MFMKKPRKELIADIKLIGFKIKPYKLWFMSRKKLERLVKEWQVVIDFRKNWIQLDTKIEYDVHPNTHLDYLNYIVLTPELEKWNEDEKRT